ncbi:MAG: agmatine deiminase family protein [Opitutales bacterium]
MRKPKSPRSSGYVLPAEWEKQSALWLSWPLNPKWWDGRIEEITETFVEIAKQAARFQPVHINCAGPEKAQVKKRLEAAEAKMGNIRFFDIPTDDVWIRDHGPLFIKHENNGQLAVTDWEFNAWGDKFPDYAQDNKVPVAIADALGIPRYRYALCLEGGAIETNGRGYLMTTRSVQLNEARNYDLTESEYQRIFHHALGVDEFIWLEDGLANDDTDGHIDNVARFVERRHIVIATTQDRDHPSYQSLRRNKIELEGIHMHGKMPEITEMPLPDPFPSKEKPIPASYLNYVVINGAVLVPQFGQEDKDTQARDILGKLFPKREIIGIDCRLLVEEGGTLHCCTCNAF